MLLSADINYDYDSMFRYLINDIAKNYLNSNRKIANITKVTMKYIFYDTETTGLSSEFDQILQFPILGR